MTREKVINIQQRKLGIIHRNIPRKIKIIIKCDHNDEENENVLKINNK